MTEPLFFATLRPANTLAKLAFSNVVENGNETSHRCMIFEPRKIFDKEALRFELERERKRERQHLDDGFDTASPTEVNTDTEEILREKGMLWTGSYILSFDRGPRNEQGLGWVAGKSGRSKEVDLVLATPRFLQDYEFSLRGQHARFNFSSERGALFIAKASRNATTELAVGGETVTVIHYMNQRSMKVRIGSLEFDFSYSAYANKPEYYREIQQYLQEQSSFSTDVAQVQIPTPQGDSRTFGDWTIGRALGKGAEGNVFFASSRHGDVVAIKVIVRTRRNVSTVSSGVNTLQTLTKLTTEHDERRIVRLKQVIYSQDTPEFDPKYPFDEVVLVLEPYTNSTLDIYMETYKARCKDDAVIRQTARIFRQLLLAVEFLHHHGWLHGDIKPENVGIIKAQPFYDVVLLDIGGSKFVGSQDEFLDPTPGCGGTVRYLAPERELQNYSQEVDVWSLGVVGFELIYGYHPWPLSKNPWRKGQDFERLRPGFSDSYEKAISLLCTDKPNENSDRFKAGLLLKEMLAYTWAKSNNQKRITTAEALQHSSWGPLLDNEGDRPSKRTKHS